MATLAAKTASLALVALAAGNAQALGLGEAVGQAVMGQPLRIEIPLLGSGSNLPSPECFRIRAPVAEIAAEFVLRNARIQVVGDRGISKLIVTSAATIREPLVGFAVTASCGFELTRDYMLLTALPAETPAPMVSLPQPAPVPVPALVLNTVSAPATAAPVPIVPVMASSAAAPKAAAPKPSAAPAAKAAAAAASDKALRVAAEMTLEALARQKYPAQPKAREKFMRMMARANPDLKDGDSVIAAGTELQLPPGLPQVRVGPYQGETKAATKESPAAAPEAPAAAPPPPAKATNPGKDRLVLGVGAEMSKAKLADEVERLTSMLAEQTQAQEALTETLAKLEGKYGELQKNFTRQEERIQRIEAERLAEKQAPKPASFDVLELLFAVLAGGTIGALLLPGLQRWQRRRTPDHSGAGEASSAAPSAAPLVTAALPWAAASNAPTNAVAVDEPAAALAPSAATPPAPTSPKLESLLPEAVQEATALESLLSDPAATVTVQVESAAVETTSDLDSLSLEFELEPQEEAADNASAAELAPPAPEVATPDAAPELPTAAVADSSGLDDFSLDFPPIPTAEPAVALAAESAAAPDLPPLEPLSLDFPPITPETTATSAEDSHVIEFAVETTPKDAAVQNVLEFPKG